MKKIDFGKLAVEKLDQKDIIRWLFDAANAALLNLDSAITNSNLGQAGEVVGSLGLIVSVAKALDEDMNGKKDPTVLQ